MTTPGKPDPGGGVLPGASSTGGDGGGGAGVGTTEIDLPINAKLPDVDASVTIPVVGFGTPCGYALPTIGGVGFPARISLGDLAGYLGLPVTFIELPPVCPEAQEILLVAAVLAAKKV